MQFHLVFGIVRYMWCCTITLCTFLQTCVFSSLSNYQKRFGEQKQIVLIDSKQRKPILDKVTFE